MRKTKVMCSAIVLMALIGAGCQNYDGPSSPESTVAPELSMGTPGGPHPRPETWVDGELFAGLVTPATFNPDSDPFDELYTGGNGFKNGVPLISESKPGDQDYNGGRWHVNVLKEGVDPDKYSTASSVEELDLNDFESTSNYFECPLLPRRGHR